MFERLDSHPLPSLLSVPEGPPPAGGWPVLFFLHGYDEAAPQPIEQALTQHGPFNPGNPPLVREQFILIAPQLVNAGDQWFRFAGAVEELLALVLDRHQGDPARCYLCGFSFGGNGVFDLALAMPGRWAALWAVDPTRLPEDPVKPPIWLSIGQIARRQEMVFIETLGLEAAASEEPAGDRLYLDEGADHVRSAQLAFKDVRIYNWLLRHRQERRRRRR